MGSLFLEVNFPMKKLFQWASYVILVIVIIDRTFFRFFSVEFIVAATALSIVLKVLSNKK